MSGLFAIAAAFMAFAVPLAIPLFVQRWRSFGFIVVAGVLFFGWLTLDMQSSADDGPQDGHWIGPFLGGLMLFGFASGVIAKFVMLISRPKAPATSETDSSTR